MSERIIIGGKESPLPLEWLGHTVTLIDALLYIRQEIQRGRPLSFFTGEHSLASLVAFLEGWGSCVRFNGGAEHEWSEFLSWLRDVKGEVPSEGWQVKFLADCAGDHTRAALKLMNFVHEFSEARQGPTAP